MERLERSVEAIQEDARDLVAELESLQQRLRVLKEQVSEFLPNEIDAEAMDYHLMPGTVAREVDRNLSQALEHFEELLDSIDEAAISSSEDLKVRWLQHCRDAADEFLPASLWALMFYWASGSPDGFCREAPKMEMSGDTEPLRGLVRVLYGRLAEK